MNTKLKIHKPVVGLACTSRGLHLTAADSNQSSLAHCQQFTANTTSWWEADENPELEQSLASFVAESGLSGANAVIGLPNDQWLLRYVSLPAMSKKQLNQAVSLELNETIHLPFDDPVFDVVPVPSLIDDETSKQAACAVITSREMTERLVRLVTQAGLVVRAIDVNPLALQRVFSSSFGSETDSYAILHLESQAVAISIFIGEDMYFHRSLDSRLLQSTGVDIGMVMNVPDIALEARRVLEFFQFSMTNGTKQIRDVYVHSEQNDAELLIQELNRVMPQQEVRYLTNVEITNPEPVSPVYYAAAGLALKRWRTA
jgi:type IV pilus assembly protein PilM